MGFTMRGRKSVFGVVLSILGLLLLLVTLLGDSTSLGNYESRGPRKWEKFDPELVARTPDYDALISEVEKRAGGSLQRVPPDELMGLLFTVIVERFTHK
jgi:hypothetical protein